MKHYLLPASLITGNTFDILPILQVRVKNIIFDSLQCFIDKLCKNPENCFSVRVTKHNPFYPLQHASKLL